MRCPQCGGETTTEATRKSREHPGAIRRVRRCMTGCGRFSTLERVHGGIRPVSDNNRESGRNAPRAAANPKTPNDLPVPLSPSRDRFGSLGERLRAKRAQGL